MNANVLGKILETIPRNPIMSSCLDWRNTTCPWNVPSKRAKPIFAD
jgi:hypothetical protein